MARTKFCPGCGSVAVAVNGARATCQNCGHTGGVKKFTADAYTPRHTYWGADAYGPNGTDPIRFERGSKENQ